MRPYTNIRLMAQQCYRIAVDHGFHDNRPLTIGAWDSEKLMLIVSEAAEALEELRKPQGPVNVNRYEDDGKPLGVPSELADIVIRVFDYAVSRNIDIAAAIAEKMAYNDKRPHMHGKKF